MKLKLYAWASVCAALAALLAGASSGTAQETLATGQQQSPTYQSSTPVPVDEPSPQPEPTSTPLPDPTPTPSPLPPDFDFNEYTPVCDVEEPYQADYSEQCTPPILSSLAVLDEAIGWWGSSLSQWLGEAQVLDRVWQASFNNDDKAPLMGQPGELEVDVSDKENDLREEEARLERWKEIVSFRRIQVRKGSASEASLREAELNVANSERKIRQIKAEIAEKKALIRARDAKAQNKKKAEAEALRDAAQAKLDIAKIAQEQAQANLDEAKFQLEKLKLLDARLRRQNLMPLNPSYIPDAERQVEFAQNRLRTAELRVKVRQQQLDEAQRKYDQTPND